MISLIKNLLFTNRSLRQTVAKNIFWLGTSQVASRFIRAAIIVYAARVLGAAEYGIFSYALGLAGFFTIFADVGLNLILTREATKDPSRGSRYFATSFWLKSLLLTITAFVLAFAAPVFSRLDLAKPLLPIVALLTVFDGIRELAVAFFRSKEKMELEAFANIFTNIAIAIFGFAVLQTSASSKTLTLSYTASAGASALLVIFILRKEFSRIFKCFDLTIARAMIKSAWPVACSAIFGAFLLNVDIVMLGWFRDAKEVGLYSSAQKIVQVLYTASGIIASSTFPAISKFLGLNELDRVKSVATKTIKAALVLALPIATGGAVLSKPLILFLYGEGYAPAAPVFQILIFTLIAIFPQAILGNFILAHDKPKEALPYLALGSFLNLAGNFLLIPRFGMIGCAIATLFVQLIFTACLWRLAKKINNFQTIRHLKKTIFASVAMGIFAFALNSFNFPVLAIIGISGVSYFLFLYLVKEPLVAETLSSIKRLKPSPIA